jgi:hypothetical protein
LSDKDFKVKNKLQVKGITAAGPITADASGNIDSVPYIATQYGGTGTTTSPASGQVLYSSSGTTYAPATLTSLIPPTTYSSTAPSSPAVGQIWVDSSSSISSFDPNIMRRKTVTATAGQTAFTTDQVFVDGYEQVYFNGMLLLRTTDYTTNGSSSTVTLTSAAAAGDIVEILIITNLNSINTATTTTNTFTGRQTVSGGASGIDIEASGIIRAKNGYRITANNGVNEYQVGPFYNFTDFQITSSTNNFAAHTKRFEINTTGSSILGETSASTYNPDSSYNRVFAVQQADQVLTMGSYWQAGVGQNSYINSSQSTSRTAGSNLFLQTGGLNRFYVGSDGNLAIVNQGVDTLRYFDIYNTHSGNSAGTIIRLITNNAANTGVQTVDMVKYRNGTFLIANNDTGSSAIFQFNNAGAERMRIDGNGYLLVGYTGSNGAYKLQVNSQIFATSSSIATSDGRYKENVDTITSGLNIVDSLRPVSFTWKDHPVHNFVAGKTVGFIAQEVQEALSEYDWVDNIIKSNYNEETEEEFLGIAESNIIPLLVAAVKELKARVETLEAN